MEPNEAKSNQVLDNILLVLGQIRAKDGYWFDVPANSVTTEDRTDDQIENGDFPYYEVTPSDSEIATGAEMPHRDLETFEVEILGFIEQRDPTKVHRDRERAIRDIRKKLQEDTHRGALEGVGTPLALWTAIRTIERLGNSDRLVAFRITLEIRFKADWTQP